METRLSFKDVHAAIEPLRGIADFVFASGLELSLLDLVVLRASQINYCAYCIDMHFKDALASGEDLQRLYSLDAWREMPIYSDRERTALAWTEAVTILGENGVPDDVYDDVRQHFDTQEIVALTMAVISINSWNRLNVSLQPAIPGTYKSNRQPQAAVSS